MTFDAHGLARVRALGGWLVALTTAGCAADPAFQASDTATDSATASDTAADSVTGTATDTVTATATDAATTADAEVSVGPGCDDGCGPAASCLGGWCTCDAPHCDGAVIDPALAVAALSVVLDAGDRPLVAFGRDQATEAGLARWAGSWLERRPIAPWLTDEPLELVLDGTGAPRVLHGGTDGELLLATEVVTSWADIHLGIGPCMATDVELDPIGHDLVLVCVDPMTGQVSLYDRNPADDTFAMRGNEPISIGRTAKRFAFGIAPTGVAWIAWVAPVVETPGTSMLNMAYLVGDTWNREPLDTYVDVAALAFTIDRESNPHILVTHVADDETLVTHIYYSDATHVASATIASEPAAPGFGARLALAPAGGARVHAVYADGPKLVWLELDGPTPGSPAVLQVASAPSRIALVSSAASETPTAYFTDADGVLRLWLPRGP